MSGTGESITAEMIDAAGRYYIDEPAYRGPVSGLASWASESFREYIAMILKKNIVSQEQEAELLRLKEEARLALRAERLKVIPDLYLKDTDKRYAVEPRAKIRRWSTLQRTIRKAGTPLRSIYIYGKSGRGKSHYAGKLAEVLTEIGAVEWCNAEELDSIIQRASGGHAGFNDMLNDILLRINRSRFIVIDDLGKPDTHCDGTTVPKRVAFLHQVIENARVNCNRQFIFTSEFAPDDQTLRLKISEGLVNRIIEMCDVVQIDEADRFVDWERKNIQKSVDTLPPML